MQRNDSSDAAEGFFVDVVDDDDDDEQVPKGAPDILQRFCINSGKVRRERRAKLSETTTAEAEAVETGGGRRKEVE